VAVIDARRTRGSGLWVYNLLMDLRFLFAVWPFRHLLIKLVLYLPGFEGCRPDHRIDTFLDPLDEPSRNISRR